MPLNPRRFGRPYKIRKRRAAGQTFGSYWVNQPRDWRGRWMPIGKRAHLIYKNNPRRGVGLRGLARNTVPYARFSTSGTTVGVNAGTILPGRRRRIVVGGYARVEHVDMYKRQVAASAALNTKGAFNRAWNTLGLNEVPAAVRMRKAAKRQVPKTVSDVMAGTRVTAGPAQVRFTSSRKYNPTITVRRGRHKVAYRTSAKGIRAYNKHFERLDRKKAMKKPRPQRRRQAKRSRK